MDMRFEVVVVPVAEVDRANDLEGSGKQSAPLSVQSAIWIARHGSRRPIANIRRPRLRGRTGRVRRLPAPLAIRSQSQRAPQARAA